MPVSAASEMGPAPLVKPFSGYRYARTQKNCHRVHVDGGMAWVREQCNLDDARYFGLLDEEPTDISHCKWCHIPVASEQELEKTEERVPAMAKKDLPRSLVMVRRPVMLALLGIAIGVPFLAGNASGVVLSPDDERGGDTGTVASPSPTCDLKTLEGCGDLVIIIERLIDEQLLDHLIIDHAPSPTPGGSPSTTPSAPVPTTSPSLGTPTPSPTARPAGGDGSSGPSRTPRPTARPASTARPPSATPMPSPAPTPTACFRPGDPQSGKDPCGWPVDDKP